MSLLKLAKNQTQEDNQKAALIDASRESDAKRLEEEISAAMDSVIIPPVDDFTPPDYVDGSLTISESPYGSQPVFDRYTPPIEKTQEQQDAEAILKSLPETMRPDNYRKIQVNTKSTVIDQIDALEKIYAVVGEAISKRKLMVKGIDAAVGIMDGKTPAKPMQAKKPAATTSKRKGRPAKNTPPLTKKVEEKKDENHTAK